MIDRTCFLCGEYVTDVWTQCLSDDTKKVEWSGHKKCIDQLDLKIKSVQDLHKKNVKKVLKELNISEKSID